MPCFLVPLPASLLSCTHLSNSMFLLQGRVQTWAHCWLPVCFLPDNFPVTPPQAYTALWGCQDPNAAASTQPWLDAIQQYGHHPARLPRSPVEPSDLHMSQQSHLTQCCLQTYWRCSRSPRPDHWQNQITGPNTGAWWMPPVAGINGTELQALQPPDPNQAVPHPAQCTPGQARSSQLLQENTVGNGATPHACQCSKGI